MSEDLFPKFLLAFVDIRIKLVTILSDREFLVVINWNVDLLRAIWFLVWVVELSYVRVS